MREALDSKEYKMSAYVLRQVLKAFAFLIVMMAVVYAANAVFMKPSKIFWTLGGVVIGTFLGLIAADLGRIGRTILGAVLCFSGTLVLLLVPNLLGATHPPIFTRSIVLLAFMVVLGALLGFVLSFSKQPGRANDETYNESARRGSVLE